MPSITVENYLKTILLEQQSCKGKIAMGHLAIAMDIAPGTATAMVKTLYEAKLVDYAPRLGVELTSEGKKLAIEVVRRHRLVELFLVEVLNLDWSEVHEEAEELEHAISEKLLERIDIFLGHPVSDPHGDPIPPAKGSLNDKEIDSLADCPINKCVVIKRVIDQSPQFLKFANSSNLIPGQELIVSKRQSTADAVTIKTKKPQRQFTIGTVAAAKIMVKPKGKSS